MGKMLDFRKISHMLIMSTFIIQIQKPMPQFNAKKLFDYLIYGDILIISKDIVIQRMIST